MKSTISSSTTQTPEYYFNTLNESIGKTTKNLFSVLGYDNNAQGLFNKAYFSATDTISYPLLTSLSDKAQTQINELHTLAQSIENITELNTIQKELFLKRIAKKILLLQYHQHAMYLEAEKPGFQLTPQEKSYHNQKKLHIEEQLYGPSILFRPERMKKVGEKLYHLFEQHGHKLSGTDQDFWKQHILSHFGQPNPINNAEVQPEKNVFIHEKTIFPLVELVLQLQGVEKHNLVKIQLSDNPELTDTQMQGDIYIIPGTWSQDRLSEFYTTHGLADKFKIIKKTSGTNSVLINTNKQQLNLGAPINGKYNLKDSVLPVIFDHEIATHVNTGIGNLHNQKLYDSTRGDLEEGIAILNERLGKGQSLEDIYEASIGDISQFLGEVCTDTELRQALKIYFDLSGNTGNQEDRLRRIRRGVAVGEKGSNRKDLTYGNSKEILREFEQLSTTTEGVALLNTYARAIYSTKLGYDALNNLEHILKGIKNIEELEPNFPIFAGKILYWKLFKGKLDKDEMLRTDIRNIIETNQEVSYTQKKLLVQLKQLIETDEEYQKRFEKQTT